MTGESNEENYVIDEGVVTECIVSRSKPADVREWDEENAIEDGESKGGPVINAKNESSSK